MSDEPIGSSIPLPPDAEGPMPTAATEPHQPAAPVINARFAQGNEGYFALVWRRFRRSVIGMIGLVLVLGMLIVSIFADFFAPMDPNLQTISFAPPDSISFEAPQGGFSLIPYVYPIVETGEFDKVTFQPLTGPDKTNPTSLGFFVKGYPYHVLWFIPADLHFFGSTNGHTFHILGTDKFGRDILSRGFAGSRISLTIALIVVLLTTTIGTLVGITSGYLGGVMAVLGWAQLSREVRSKTLALARIEYVRAAIAVGSGDFRIITRHILPNVLSHIIVAVTLAVPSVVLLESFLGFLGFAVKPPLISWGLMLQDTGSFSVIGSYPWIL